MGAVSALTALSLMLTAQVAPAADLAPAGEVRRRTQDPERLAPFGLMLDAGVTEGAGLSVSFQPTKLVRLHLGGTHNGMRPGARAGLTLLPLRGWLTPALSLELGHARPADARCVERRLADRTLLPSPSFERVGYTYASALLGFEMRAPQQRLTFFVRGGFSFIELYGPGIEGLDDPFRGALAPEETRPWRVRSVRPTAKLGILLSFG
ncbi:hypothetical protein HPC49_53820 [Pyxidicoccus fallax]|uniref:Outer membrane protein beta-barrel domain-containing protein n=1 Tax=Pyxidicoccus fallax TaxID=394095 RepID=A0A848LZZ9_9BACT|nr:hypothetical protein [Pyxidicoccus fallax]NMO23170.1 hypothetical protein [Pyxidicoccus fallax]NPC87048.1 hypothetical protein [Pyxidicoccus fallax]